jgi:parallel beta-helix repeat protein
MRKNRSKRICAGRKVVSLEFLETRTLFTTLTVGPSSAYHTIQSAVNAAHAGDSILVTPGTYTEQVTIPSGLNNLTISAQNPQASPAGVALPAGASIATINSLLPPSPNASIIQAPASMSSPKAIVYDNGANNLHITGFIIQGPGGGPNDSIEFGVLIDHASNVEIDHSRIVHIHDTPTSNVQKGIGIEAELGSSANIHDNFLADNQKSGIIIDGAGSSGTVNSNVVLGLGPTTLLAGNGIEFDYSATGSASFNTITGDIFSPRTAESAGILAFQSGAVTLSYNTAYNNDGDIILSGTDNGSLITGNTTYGAGFDGIALFETTNSTVDANVSHDNIDTGLFLDDSTFGNVIENNQFLHNNQGGGSWDIEDDTYNASHPGNGTYGTSNTYLNNTFNTSNFPVTGSTVSIFSPSSAPAGNLQNVNDPQIAASGGVDVGLKFRSDVAGLVTGVRFYKGSFDTGPHIGELWSSTGQLLATATFSNETASGWQQVNFSSPVAISANTTYIVAYHTAAPYIAYTPNALASSGIDNGVLHALVNGLDGPNGVYHYDVTPGTPVFPNVYNGQAPNYWVDVAFNSSVSSTPASIFAASAAPAPGLQNVNDPTIAADGGVELGTKFTSDVGGLITGVRFFKGSLDTGVHTGELWSSTGQLLATATFSNETASGWQQVTFSNAVAIAPNTTYIIAYHTTAAYIAYTPGAFSSSGIDNGHLHVPASGPAGGNGVYNYDVTPGQSSFPSVTNGQSPNYWVDVMFTPG